MNMFTKKLNWLIMSMMLMVSGSAWAGDVTDVLNYDFIGTTGTTYKAFSGKTGTSGAVYAGQSAGGSSSIQLRTKDNNSGIVTTISGGKVKSITITFNSATLEGRTVNVYGKNTAYEAATDLYDTETSGDELGSIAYGSTSTSLTIDGDYTFIGLRSSSSALYLDEVQITWETSGETPPTPAKEEAGLAYTETEFTIDFGDDFTAPTLTNPYNLTVSYASDNTDVATVADNGDVTIKGVGTATITASFAGNDDYKAGSASYTLTVNEAPVVPVEGEKTGTIIFGNDGTKINKASVTGEDSQGNTWTITTTGTSSFTANADYYQVGSSKSPATSITFTTTLPSSRTIKSMSAKFGGFGGTAGTVTLKVGDTTVGTGSLNATADVTVKSTSEAAGTVLTVTVTDIEKGVKCYNISYTYEDDGTVVTKTLSSIALSGEYPTEFEQGEDFSHEGMIVTATYDDESTADVTAKAVFSGYDMSTAGEQTVSVTYTEGEVSTTATYTITVNEKAPITIEDGVFDFALGTDYGSGYDYSSVETQSGTWTAVNVTMNTAGRNCWFKASDGSTTLRLYKKYSDEAPAGSMEFAVPEGNVITKIVFEGKDLGNLVPDGGSYKNGTWTGAANPIKFTAKETTQITKITVTYEEGTPVEKEEAGLAYESTEFTIDLGDTFTAPTLINENGLEVIYTSSNEDVATVDADGNVTIVGAGTTTITASFAGNDDYYEGSASYTLTVNEVVAPYENIAALIAANLKNGTVVSVKLTNAQVQYVNTTTKDLFIADETAGIDLYQTSLTYTQGQILNGVLTGTWSPYNNLPELKAVDATGVTVTDGTIEPKVITASEVKDNVCRLVKIENQTATETDGKYYIDDDVQLFNKYGLSTYYTTNPADYVGIAVVFKEIYELNVISFTEVEMAETIKVGPAGIATYVTKNAVEFKGVKAYAVTKINEKSVSRVELTSAPAGTPIIVEAAEGEYPCTIIESAEAPEVNKLTYSEEDVVSDGTIYALANKPEADGIGFYPVKSGVKVPAGKAYLVIDAKEVKGFLALDDVADAINNIVVETANGTIFNIAGQKVQNITKGGLYIVNGKKVVVK